MACGCKRSRRGSNSNTPYLIGNATDDAPIQVRAMVNGFPFKRNTIGWVYGDAVQNFIDAGYIAIP